MRKSISAMAIGISFALAVLPGRAGDIELRFPEAHKEFLGAASYSAMFGPLRADAETSSDAFSQQRWGPPSIGANRQVNDDQAFPFGRNEPTIAVSGNGKFMVLGWNDGEGFCGPPFSDFVPLPCPSPEIPGFTGFGHSSDGGRTFVDGGAPPVGDSIGFGPGPSGVSVAGEYITLGDPSMDVGGYGNETFYFANLAEFIDQVHVGLGFDPTAGVVVHSGRFGPTNQFDWTGSVLLQSPNYPWDYLDKEHIAADKGQSSDSVYVSVTNFAEVDGVPFFGFGQIEVYSSPDGGASWDRSVVQPDETISVSVAGGTGVANQGSQPAVGPDGTVFVAWERGWQYPVTVSDVTPEIRVASSTDGGQTWFPYAAMPPSSGVNPAGTLVSKICAGSLFPPAGYNRLTSNDFPRISVAGDGPYRGRVYVVWNDCRIANGGTQEEAPSFGHQDTDIYLAFSDDKGESWSAPILVSGGGDDRIQFWPTVSVQPGGDIDIAYYESVEAVDPDRGNCVVPIGPGGSPPFRESAERSLVDLYYVRSSDGGSTFGPPNRISDVTTDWCDAVFNTIPNFGDYNTAVSAGNRVFATWTDGRNGAPDIFFGAVGTK